MMNTENKGKEPSKDEEEQGVRKPSKLGPTTSNDADLSSGDESHGETGGGGKRSASGDDNDDYSNLERLRKAKRLAMNRASARNRRKQKKEMLETLEKQVEELRRVNQGLMNGNQSLNNKIAGYHLDQTVKEHLCYQLKLLYHLGYLVQFGWKTDTYSHTDSAGLTMVNHG